MRVVVLLCVLAACGRVGFDPARIAGDGGADDAVDGSLDPDAMIDAAMVSCAGGDSICNVMCTVADPDCTTTCGDGICVGNIGELCRNCPADCATTNPVCGNGACDPRESAATCIADCGPSPWPWDADEQAIITMINSVRTAGYTCLGGALTTAPAMIFTPALRPGTREWVWEYAHQGWNMDPPCNGRTIVDRGYALGASGTFAFAYSFGVRTVGDAMAFWLNDVMTCNAIMDSQYTTIAVGAAHDIAPDAYVLILD